MTHFLHIALYIFFLFSFYILLIDKKIYEILKIIYSRKNIIRLKILKHFILHDLKLCYLSDFKNKKEKLC